jgi:thiol-disulfide isomerase/thioredoxin
LAGVQKLRANGTPKLRLFNVWATWCAPCVAEFPELVSISRQFSRRDFELITRSVDDPNDLPRVKEFLEKKGAGLPEKLKPTLKTEGRTTNSYVYTGADTNALMKALDPQWPGGVPHTVLVSPSGEILWRHAGQINGDELRAKIIEVLGPYYKP